MAISLAQQWASLGLVIPDGTSTFTTGEKETLLATEMSPSMPTSAAYTWTVGLQSDILDGDGDFPSLSFADGTYWDLGSGGTATLNAGSPNYLEWPSGSGNNNRVHYEAYALIAGVRYQADFTIASRTAGNVRTVFGGVDPGNFAADDGTYSKAVVAGSTNDEFRFSGFSSFDGQVHTVTVKPLHDPKFGVTSSSTMLAAMVDKYWRVDPLSGSDATGAPSDAAVTAMPFKTWNGGVGWYANSIYQAAVSDVDDPDTWAKEFVDVTSDQATMTFETYDPGGRTGTYHIVCGSDAFTGWTVYSGDTFQVACTTEPFGLWRKGGSVESTVRLVRDADEDKDALAAGEWTWESSVIYYRPLSGANPDSDDVIRAAQRDICMRFEGATASGGGAQGHTLDSYWFVQGNGQAGAAANLTLESFGTGSNITVTRCRVNDAVINGVQVQIAGCSFDNMTIEDIGRDGIQVVAVPGATTVNNATIDDINQETTYHQSNSADENYNAGDNIQFTPGCGDITVTNCTLTQTDTDKQCIIANSTGVVTITDNVFRTNGGTPIGVQIPHCTYAYIRRNKFIGPFEQNGILFVSDSNSVRYKAGDGWSAHGGGTDTYKITLTNTTLTTVFESTGDIDAPTPAEMTNGADEDSLAAGEWYETGGELYVRLTGGEDPSTSEKFWICAYTHESKFGVEQAAYVDSNVIDGIVGTNASSISGINPGIFYFRNNDVINAQNGLLLGGKNRGFFYNNTLEITDDTLTANGRCLTIGTDTYYAGGDNNNFYSKQADLDAAPPFRQTGSGESPVTLDEWKALWETGGSGTIEPLLNQDQNSNWGAALLRDVANEDYRPTTLSPLVGAGAVMVPPVTDITGTLIDMTPSQIGAYQEVVLALDRPTTGGPSAYAGGMYDETAEQRRERILAERRKLGIVPPAPVELPAPSGPDFAARAVLRALKRLEAEGAELERLQAEMQRMFIGEALDDAEIQRRLIYALEWERRRRVALLLLFL